MSSIGKEFVDTIQAKILDIIRGLQDPRQQVELSIKQLENVLEEAMNNAAQVSGQAGLIRSKAKAEQKTADDFAASARLAMKKAKSAREAGDNKEADELEAAAKQALLMQMTRQDLANQYNAQADELDKQVARLTDEIAKLRLLIAKLKARKEAVIATEVQAAAVRAVGRAQQGADVLDDILATFERMEDKATLRLKTEQARAALARDPLAEKLDQVTADARVEEAFEQLKKSV